MTVDWLSVACRRPEAFKLEACSEVVPLLEPLLGSPHDKYVLVALGALQMLLQAFGQVGCLLHRSPLLSFGRLALSAVGQAVMPVLSWPCVFGGSSPCFRLLLTD